MWVCIILVYVRMYVYTWRSVIFSLFRMKRQLRCHSGGQRKYESFEWGKIINIFSFMWMRRRNFHFFFIRISVVVWINSFLPFPQTCEDSVLLGSSRFLMLSVDSTCAFPFSLRERERDREGGRERERLDTERDRETERETRH